MKTLTIAMITMAVFMCLNPSVIDAWWVRANNGDLCLSPCIYARQGDFYLDGIEIKDGNTLYASCATDYIYNTTRSNDLDRSAHHRQSSSRSSLREFHTCDPDSLLYEGGYVLADNGRYCTTKCETSFGWVIDPSCYTYGDLLTASDCEPKNVIPNEQQQYLTIYGSFCTGPCRPVNADGEQHYCFADYRYFPYENELCSAEEGFSVTGKKCTSHCSKNGKDYYWCNVDSHWLNGEWYDWDYCSPPFERIENCENEVSKFSGNFEDYPETYKDDPEDLEQLCSGTPQEKHLVRYSKGNDDYLNRWPGWPYIYRDLNTGTNLNRPIDEGNGLLGIISRAMYYDYGSIPPYTREGLLNFVHAHVAEDPDWTPWISTFAQFGRYGPGVGAENFIQNRVRETGIARSMAIIDASLLPFFHVNLNERGARDSLLSTEQAREWALESSEVVLPWYVPSFAVIATRTYFMRGNEVIYQDTSNNEYDGGYEWPIEDKINESIVGVFKNITN